MESLFKNLYLPGADQQELSPTFAETMGAAFGLENDVVNLYDYLTKPAYTPDLSFNFKERFNRDKLPIDMMPILSRAKSEGEYNALLAQARDEYKKKAVLAASGWTGTVAAIGAGVLSPTSFIPFVGQGKRGWAFAEVLGLSAAAATAQNAALYLNQATRTEAELYSGIALDTLLGGMLGGAWLTMSKSGRARLAGELDFRQQHFDVPTGPMDLGGAERKLQRVEYPSRAEYEVASKTPSPVRDVAATPAAKIEPPKTQPGVTRVYFSGNLSDDAEIKIGSTDREAMAAKDEAAPLYYVDLPEDSARFSTFETDLSPEEVKGLREIYRGRGDADAEVKDLLAQVEEGEAQKAAEDGMAPTIGEEAISKTGKAADSDAAGAQVTRRRNTSGAAPAPNKVRQALLDAVGKVSPQYRMLTNRFFPSLRDAIARLDMSGLKQGNLEHMEPSAKGGTAIERIRGHGTRLVDFAVTLDREFYNYIYDGAKGLDFNSPALTQLKTTFFGTPPGKLNWQEFKAAVFDGQNTGKFAPELANSVQAFDRFFKHYTAALKDYMDEFAREGREVEPLFKELLSDEMGEGVTGYAHHMFDGRKIMEQMSEFIDDFSSFYERQLTEDYGNDYKKYVKRKSRLEYEQMLDKLSSEELSSQLAGVENDIEFLEQMPEWQDYRQQRLDILRASREENWTKEQLKGHLNELKDNAPPTVLELMSERKRLMGQSKLMRNMGGDADAVGEKLQAEIAKADGLIDEMFRSTIPRIQKADLDIGKLQAKGDAALNAAAKDLASVVKGLEKRRAQMAKLLSSSRNNSLSRAKVNEQLEALAVKYAAMQERLSAVQGQNMALDARLSEINLLREDAIADATRLVRSRAARLEDLEEKLEKVAAKKLAPEDKVKNAERIETELYDNDRNFDLKWGKRGDQSGDSLSGTPDFRERALEMATLLHQKLTNSEIELSPAWHALRQDARGAELLRVMKIPYDLKQRWLVKDVEIVTRSYARVMAPDLEIWRASDGSVNGKSWLSAMQEEATAHYTRIGTSKYVKLPAGWSDKAKNIIHRVQESIADFGETDELYLDAKSFSNEPGPGFIELTPELRTQLGQAVAAAAKDQTRNLDVAIQRLRNTRGVPQNGNGLGYRVGKFVKSLNVATMMGGVITASVSDIARPISSYGVKQVYRHGWKPFISGLIGQGGDFRVKSKEVNRRTGVNLEPMLHGRSQSVFDLAEDSIGRTKLERGVQFAANKMGLVAAYDYWTAGMKVITANVTHATLAEYIPQVAKAYRDGVEPVGDTLAMRTWLRKNGLRDLDIHRIALQMEAPGGMERFSNGGVLPNLGAWNDAAAYKAYQAAVLSEVNKLIVTPGLERPNFMDENMAWSVLTQFKSFVYASNSRMLMSNLQGNDPYLMQGVTFSLAFGAVSYYTYALSAGGKTYEKAMEGDVEHWAWEAFHRSGLLGVLSLGTDLAAEIPWLSEAAPQNPIFQKPTGILGAFLGPTYGQAEKMAEFIMKAKTDDPKQKARNLRNLRQVWVPYQNHFLLRQLIDRAADAMFGG